MVYHRSWRLPTTSSWKHSKALFNTLGSPVGGGGFNPRRLRRGTAAHPSRHALARRGIRSWRLLGLRSKREALGSLSWNILENS